MSVEKGTNEEVDLGNLFKLIGQGIKALFMSVATLLERLFHNLILLLIFLRKHALKLGIAVGIGAGIGLYLDLTKPDVFTSTMIVQPNFKSTQQLYNNIGFYHELVKQKDSIALSKALGITPYEASKLKGFYIKPIKNDNEKIELFDEFIEEVDTTTVKNIDVKEFKRNFSDFDYKYHKVKVRSELNDIYNKISNSIINSIINTTIINY